MQAWVSSMQDSGLRGRWHLPFVAAALAVVFFVYHLSLSTAGVAHCQFASALAPQVPTAPRCDFDYDGPLQEADLNCFIELFPFASPVALVPIPNGTHDVRGVRILGDAPPIPIFITFKDRVSVLMETIRSLHRHIRTPFEIVVFNDNSTYPAAINFLQRLRQAGVVVHNNQQSWENFDQLYAIIAAFITEYMADSPSPYFVWTDPDCALDSAPGHILLAYQQVLQDKPELYCAGAAIRWDDWPPWLPDDLVYADMSMTITPQEFKFRNRPYFYSDAPIDTTFCMYKKGTPLVRLTAPTIRLLPPLAIRHLDFYFDPAHPPADYIFYVDHARQAGVNHMTHVQLESKNEPTNSSAIPV